MEPFECSQLHFLGHFLKVPLIYRDPHLHTIEIDLGSHSLEKDLRSDRFHSQPDPQLSMKPGNNNEHLILFLDLIKILKLASFDVLFIPYFCLLVFGILVTLVA